MKSKGKKRKKVIDIKKTKNIRTFARVCPVKNVDERMKKERKKTQ